MYFRQGEVTMSAYADKLVEEYRPQRQEYVSFTQSVRDLLQQLVKVEGLDIVGIEDRTTLIALKRKWIGRRRRKSINVAPM